MALGVCWRPLFRVPVLWVVFNGFQVHTLCFLQFVLILIRGCNDVLCGPSYSARLFPSYELPRLRFPHDCKVIKKQIDSQENQSISSSVFKRKHFKDSKLKVFQILYPVVSYAVHILPSVTMHHIYHTTNLFPLKNLEGKHKKDRFGVSEAFCKQTLGLTWGKTCEAFKRGVLTANLHLLQALPQTDRCVRKRDA